MAAAPAKARFVDRWLLSRPRLAASVAAAVAAAFALRPDHAATRWLCAWNVGTWLYIALAVVMMARSDDRAIRSRAAGTDDGKWAILVLTVLAAACAMGAILVEIAIAKDLKGPLRGLHLGLAGLTLVSAWVFIHLTFALHYAHEYFDEHKGREGEMRRLRGGLRFPETTDPDYWDFLYFSFIIGVATQTADVEISSKAMRRTSLAHSVLAFFFNSAVLALTINIAAGLV